MLPPWQLTTNWQRHPFNPSAVKVCSNEPKIQISADIDEQSLRLGIHLQSLDAAALLKGKQREDEQPPDVEFAAEPYKLKLDSLQTFYSDRALCRRLSDLGLKYGPPLRGRSNTAQPATNKPKSTAPDKTTLAQSSKSSTPATGGSVNVVAKETTKQSDEGVASTRSIISCVSDISVSIRLDEETPETGMPISPSEDYRAMAMCTNGPERQALDGKG